MPSSNQSVHARAGIGAAWQPSAMWTLAADALRAQYEKLADVVINVSESFDKT